MGIETHPLTGPGGPDRDDADFQRFRHARERETGFRVGRYLQPAPLLFTRDGHNVFLGDMYRGKAAFLICGGPSLLSHDLSQLQQRGILTLAVNNAAAVFRPQLWCSVDDPTHFVDAIWRDPGVMKFVPLCHMEKTFLVRNADEELAPAAERVGDMPAVFGFRRNEAFNAAQWLYEDTFNWGNHSNRTDAEGLKGSRSVMYVALRLLFFLGVRQVYLLGCDFRMELGKQNYAFEQDRSPSSVRGNNSSYRILNARLQRLAPYFEREGFDVRNCTPDSGLTVFPYVPFAEAVAAARAEVPSRIVTAGMYDRSDRLKAAAAAPPADVPVLNSPARDPVTAAPEPSDVTLVLVLNEQTVPLLAETWRTWLKHKPVLTKSPIVVVHPPQMEMPDELPDELQGRADVVTTAGNAEDFAGNGLHWRSVLQTALPPVRTPWYLVLDPRAVATGEPDWPRAEWFQGPAPEAAPVIVASSWSYSKPANILEQLNAWGDTRPELRLQPQLEQVFDPQSDRVKHPTISSWCCIGNTAWTRDVEPIVEASCPTADFAALLNYLALRLGRRVLRLPMKDHGWDHSFGWGLKQVRSRCRTALEASVAGIADDDRPLVDEEIAATRGRSSRRNDCDKT